MKLSMKPSRISAAIMLAVAVVTGCRDEPGNGGDNGGGTDFELTAAQQLAIDDVVEQIEASASAIASLAPLAAGRGL